MKKVRRKAFLGSLIGSAIGTVTSLIGASKQAEAQEELYRKQKQQNDLRNAYISSSNLTAGYNSSNDYANELIKRVTYKYGGNKRNKKYGAGGAAFSAQDTADVFTGFMNGIGNLVNGDIRANTISKSYTEAAPSSSVSQPKTEVKLPDYKQQIINAQKMSSFGNNIITDNNSIKKDITTLKPTSVVNSPFQFTPMQLFCLGGLRVRKPK